MRSVERTVSLLHDPFLELFSGRPSFDLILYYQKAFVFCITRKCMYTKHPQLNTIPFSPWIF